MVFLGIVAVSLLVLVVLSPHIRIAFLHPLLDLYYSFRDLFKYIRYRRWRECPSGAMVCYSGLFGRGKTLSAVHEIAGLYRRYNNKLIFDSESGRWVVQKIHILSNVTLSIPFTPLRSLSEIVSECDRTRALDKQSGFRTVILVLIDEASVQLNSRGFRNNISPDFLNTILTCRHYHMSLFYTSQRFNLTDKLFRDVTQTVIDCHKLWRLQGQYIYDAWTLENSSRPDEVRPLKRCGFFVTDSDFALYDTLAVVDTLAKSGDMLSDAEILSRRAGVIDFSGGAVASGGKKKKRLI